jgi:polyisoprenyl-teichoic acid--peptidoglycan teichoic acid transferase
MSRTGHQGPSSGDAYSRRLLRALFSSVLPGAGQVTAGARKRGFVMLAVVVAVLLCGVFIVLQGVDQILLWWVEPSVLLGLLGVNLVLLLFRLFAVIDAFQTRRTRSLISAMPSPPRTAAGGSAGPTGAGNAPSRWRLAVTGAGLGVLLLLTIAPHAVAGYYTYVSYDLLTTVFASEDDQEATTTSLPPSTTTPASTAVATATTERTSTTGVAATTLPATTLTTAPATTAVPIESGDDQRLTIMCIGTDEGYGRSGARADVIMVASFDLVTGRIALFSVPRNTGSIALSDAAAAALGTDVYVNLISSLYFDANQHPELAPEGGDAGAEVLRDAVSTILGIPVDYYAVVNMGGLVDLIDAFGGVTVNVPERIWVRLSPPTADEEWQVYDIQPGVQHLNGLEALAFARSRTGSNDYVRMGRQRCVIGALLDQNGVAEIVLKFPTVAGVIKDNVKTDIPIDALQDLISIRSELKSDEMITVGFIPPDYITGRNSLGYNILDLELVQATVRQILDHPEEVLATGGAGMNLDTSDCWKVEE